MRAFRYWIICLVGFCLAAAGLRSFLPSPKIDGVTRKIRFMEEHGDDINTLFIGSSRAYHGLNPSVFDAVTAAAGSPTHSYNFGVDGMLPPETFYVIDQILTTKPRRLRWVFIELDDMQVTIAAEHLNTQRALYWHDWKRTWIVGRRLLELDIDEKWRKKRNRILRNRDTLLLHLGLLERNLTNAGRGFDLAGANPPEDNLSPLDYEPKGDGYAPAIMQMEEKRTAQYEAWLANDLAHAHPRAVDIYAAAVYRHYAEEFRVLGAKPIFFVTPVSTTFQPSKFPGTQPAPVLAFNDPGVYPGLYRPGVRIDEAHLNATGADELTKALALRFLELEAPHK